MAKNAKNSKTPKTTVDAAVTFPYPTSGKKSDLKAVKQRISRKAGEKKQATKAKQPKRAAVSYPLTVLTPPAGATMSIDWGARDKTKFSEISIGGGFMRRSGPLTVFYMKVGKTSAIVLDETRTKIVLKKSENVYSVELTVIAEIPEYDRDLSLEPGTVTTPLVGPMVALNPDVEGGELVPASELAALDSPIVTLDTQTP